MKKEKTRFYKELILTCILLIIIGGAYIYILISQQQKETKNYLYEISKKETAIIYQQLTGDLDSLQLISEFIKEEEDININKIKNIIQEKKLQNNFYEIIINIKDNNYFLNNHKIDTDIIKNKIVLNNISEEIKIENKFYYLYYIPIYSQNKEVGSLIALKDSNTIKKIMDTNIFNGEGYSQLISNTGEIIIRSNHINSNKEVNNIFEVNFKNEEQKNKVQKDLQKQKSGTNKIVSHKDKIKKVMTYLPVEINNLYIATFIPEQTINNEFTKIILLSILLIISVVFIILLFIILLNKRKEESKRKILDLAYKDELTQRI